MSTITIPAQRSISPYWVLFLANLPLIAFFVYIDEGDYDINKFLDPFTWLHIIIVNSLFALIGWGVYALLSKFWTFKLGKLIVAWFSEIPVIILIMYLVSMTVRWFS